MARHLKILEHALSSLLRRKGKNAAIVVVFVLTISILTSILFLTESLKVEAAQLLSSAPDLVVQRLAAGRHELIPRAYAETLRTMPGVGAVHPRVWGYYYDALTESNYTLLGIQRPPEDLELLRGRMPSAPGECAVGAGVAEARSTGLEDDLILVDSQNLGVVYEVVGVFDARSNLLTNDLVVLTEDDLVEFFGLPEGLATDIAAEVYNPLEVETVAEKVKRALPDTRPITRSEIARTYEGVLHWRSGMMMAVFAAVLVAFCVLAWDKATGISADERQEIGILKAVGWDTSDVLELKFWEGLVISLTAVLAGLAIAYVHVFWLGAPVLEPILKGWSVLFPDFRLTPHVDLYQVFAVAFLTVVPYVASTVIPSWKAAVTDPESVIRG